MILNLSFGRSARCLVAAGAAALAMAATASAAPPPVTITAGPNSPGSMTIEAERKLATKPGQPQTYRINPVFLITNTGSTVVKLEKYEVSDVVLCNICPAVIEPGATARVISTRTAKGALPVPSSLAVTFQFAGYDDVQQSFGVRLHRNDTLSGAYNFPMKQSDVVAGTYWLNGEDTDDDSHHHDAIEQIHAYDFLIGRWDETAKRFVTRKEAGKDAMTNFHAYGKPIYAMDDGEILECRRSLPDLAIGAPGDKPHRYGNALWIRHGNGEVAAYAHTIPGSIPAALCPTESVNEADGGGTPVHAQPVRVRAGQLIGLVGNSGNSSGPHLHLSLSQGAPSDVDDSRERSGPGLPLHFDSIETAPLEDPTAGIAWVKTPDGLGGGIPGLTILRPHPCGWNPPGAGALDASYVAISEGCLQERVLEAFEAGYQPVMIDGFAASGGSAFNVSMRPGRPATLLHASMTAAGYQAKVKHLAGEGFRLIDVNAYLRGSSVRYAAIWAKVDGPRLSAYHGVSHTDHARRFKTLTGQGLRPKVISVVGGAGKRRYAAIYEKSDVGRYRAETIAVSNFKARFKQLTGQGLKPVYVDGFNLGATGHLSTIWTSKASGNYTMLFGLPLSGVVPALTAQRAAGRVPVALTGYRSGSMQRFAAIWRR